MSVNLSGNQNTDYNVETLSTNYETVTKEEYNRSVEQYKAVMSTFEPEAACDGFQTITKSKNLSTKKQTESTDNSESDNGIIKKTTSWLSDLLGINETASDGIDLSAYDALLPSLGMNKTLKEYNMTLEALNF